MKFWADIPTLKQFLGYSFLFHVDIFIPAAHWFSILRTFSNTPIPVAWITKPATDLKHHVDSKQSKSWTFTTLSNVLKHFT